MNISDQILKSFLVLRPIAQDELVTGYIVSRRYYSIESLPNIIKQMGGKTYDPGFDPRIGSWLLPSNLTEVSSIFGEFTGDPETLLQNNTVYPLLSRFLPPEESELLRRHYLYSGVRSIASKVGLTSMTNRGNRRTFASCRRCAIEDITADGLPFWRRDFILPGVAYCSKHSEPLLIPCLICNPDFTFSRPAFAPSKTCGCNFSQIPTVKHSSNQVEKEIELATAIKRLLTPTYLPGLNPDLIAQAISSRAEELGLVQNRTARRMRVQAFADEKDPAGALTGIYFKGMGTRALYSILTSRTSPRNAVSTIRLLQALHGSWSEAEAALNKLINRQAPPFASDFVPSALMTRSSNSCRKRSSKVPLTEAQRHEIYFAYVEEYRSLRRKFPDIPISTLALRLPSKARAVFSRKFLVEMLEEVPARCTGDDYYAKIDDSLALHIRSVHRKLMQSETQRRISRNVLLKGHKMASIWKGFKHRLSEAIAALDECEESYADWRRRKLLNRVLENKVPSITPEDCDAVSKLDDETVSGLLKGTRPR